MRLGAALRGLLARLAASILAVPILAVPILAVAILAVAALVLAVLAPGILLAVQDGCFVGVGRGFALRRRLTLRGLLGIGRLLRRLWFTGRRLLFARHRLFADSFFAVLFRLILRLFTFGGSRLLIGRGLNRLGLRRGLSGRRNFDVWRFVGRRGLNLLILLALFLARLVVVCRRHLFGGRCLLGRLLGRLFSGRRFDLLLVALLLAWL
ncbi:MULTISPECIES: hypothetical protein [unclassified Mesorhizobium]|uniref:hypothetical protein n=1 Tax=unclassified Mesorhizobium TaxID=325217 RepID=UPI001FD97686|nr:hypothetical protein [Mesorhizobium sp. LSJC269B00]